MASSADSQMWPGFSSLAIPGILGSISRWVFVSHPVLLRAILGFVPRSGEEYMCVCVGGHKSTSYWGTRPCDHEMSLDLQHRTLNSLQPWQSFWFGAPIHRCSGILPPLCFRGVIPDSAAPHPQPPETCLTLSLNYFPRNQIPASYLTCAKAQELSPVCRGVPVPGPLAPPM